MQLIFMMTDGLRPDAITEETTPNLIQFMARGSYTRKAQSVMPSITLPCHTSIFHSVPPSRHGIQENVWHSMARPVPGLIEQLRVADKRCGFVYNWEQLRDLNRPGNLHHSFFSDTSYNLDGDKIICDKAIEQIKLNELDFMFVYWGTVDTAGHASGWMSDEYLKQATLVDSMIGNVLAELPDDTTVIIQSDHGGHERSHGTDMPEDMNIPWMIAGRPFAQTMRFRVPFLYWIRLRLLSRSWEPSQPVIGKVRSLARSSNDRNHFA